MRRSRPQASGFSLIELLVAVSIFGMLIAIAVPSTRSFLRATRLAGATNTLVADLHNARALANAQRKTYEIRFRPDGYTIVRLSPGATIRRRTLPRGVACTASDTATFYAWGLTDPVTVTMANGRGTKAVRLAANGSVTHD